MPAKQQPVCMYKEWRRGRLLNKLICGMAVANFMNLIHVLKFTNFINKVRK